MNDKKSPNWVHMVSNWYFRVENNVEFVKCQIFGDVRLDIDEHHAEIARKNKNSIYVSFEAERQKTVKKYQILSRYHRYQMNL